MNRKLVIVGVGLFAAGALFYFTRNTQPSADQTQGLVRRDAARVKSICVKPVQNLSHQPVDLTGVDDALVAQLRKTGFEAMKTGEGSCDATVISEIVEVSGRGRKIALVDYRLLLTSEEVPRLALSATGKTPDSATAKAGVAGFVDPVKKTDEVAAREAVEAAFQQQVEQIQTANKNGLPDKFQAR